MAPLWSLTIVTIISLINFTHATYDESARTNIALYWVCFPKPKILALLTRPRVKERINNAYSTSATNLPLT